MTVLIIDKKAEAAIAALIEKAKAKPISKEVLMQLAEGFDPNDPKTRNYADGKYVPLEYTIALESNIKVTFTYEEQPIGLARHISVSTPTTGMLPPPQLVHHLLGIFGFTKELKSARSWKEDYGGGMFAINVVELVEQVPA